MKNQFSLKHFQNIQNLFFIGVAGTGMSALAQYTAGLGKQVAGSDRFFSANSSNNEVQQQLTNCGIQCFPQDGSGINNQTDWVIISTAVEESNVEYQKAKSLGIPILKRSSLLSILCKTKKTIAVGGTSGKSTTTAMIFDILDYAGLAPSIISGAGLIRLQKQGKIGNAHVGSGNWLVIEADESDGSIVNYEPEIGILLNIDKDHKEIEELNQLFHIFKNNSKLFITNSSHSLAAKFSQNPLNDFSSTNCTNCGFSAANYVQHGMVAQFFINHIPFILNAYGKHNMENALAAVAVANKCGVSLTTCGKALESFEGIYRRNQLIGRAGNIWVIDDYAHNPAKVAAAIKSVQPLAAKLIAWFQPHGYGPTRFLRNDFVTEIKEALREEDEIWMSEIYYAGGTAEKNISANDLIKDLKKLNCNAYFVENRVNWINEVIKNNHLTADTVILLMGARDPELAQFAQVAFSQLQNHFQQN